MDELKPCPFCGGEMLYLYNRFTLSGDLWDVGCETCRCRIWGLESEAKAKEAWNLRVDDELNELLQKIQQLERDNEHLELQNRQFQALCDRCDTEQKQRRKTERENRQFKDMLVRMVDMLAVVMEHGRLSCSERSVSPADCKGCERRAGCVTYDCVRVLERALRMGVIAEGYRKVGLEL